MINVSREQRKTDGKKNLVTTRQWDEEENTPQKASLYQRECWIGSFWGSHRLYISDIIGDKDLFMDLAEISLTDPFMAMFIAAYKESCAKWTNRVVNFLKDIR